MSEPEQVVLGIDLGTTATKVVAFDRRGAAQAGDLRAVRAGLGRCVERRALDGGEDRVGVLHRLAGGGLEQRVLGCALSVRPLPRRRTG